MRLWSSRRQQLLPEHDQYGRPGGLNPHPGQSPDRPGLTERVRLKSPEGYGGHRAEIQARADTLRTSVFRFDDAGATFQLETSTRHGRRESGRQGRRRRQMAGAIVPRHSPSPMVAKPWRRQRARMTTVSPSSRKRRVSPEGSSIGRRPPAEISSKLPSPPSSGAEIVPVPNRSPARTLQAPLRAS